MEEDGLPVAIVGAGFSGTMTALHLLRTQKTRPVLLFEKADSFGRGIAYSAASQSHLLNVRAANMSAYPDRPAHFVEWLRTHKERDPLGIEDADAGTFVSRSLYGAYVSSLLREAVQGGEEALRLTLVPDEVVDIRAEGTHFRVVTAGGQGHKAAGVVLAVGHSTPSVADTGPYVADPWSRDFNEGLSGTSPVVIVGSGLTMVDITRQLFESGFRGPVIAISRRGLLPSTHDTAPPWPTPSLLQDEQTSMALLLKRLRAEAAAARAAGASWRSVVDSLRPITSQIWQGLPVVEQQRFLRHAQPWWDIHRHRMAPSVGRHIHQLIEQGRLSVRAGKVKSISPVVGGARVSYRQRGCRDSCVLEAQKVINATGSPQMDRVMSPLLTRLIDCGLAAFDCHGLGLAVTTNFELLGGSGTITPNLWALGPITRGVFWECIAVPDIRTQAVQLAKRITE